MDKPIFLKYLGKSFLPWICITLLQWISIIWTHKNPMEAASETILIIRSKEKLYPWQKKKIKRKINLFQIKVYWNKSTRITCTSTSCSPAACTRIEKRDKSTPLVSMVASANRIANDMQPKITANDFSRCFHNIHLHRNSGKFTIKEIFVKIQTLIFL